MTDLDGALGVVPTDGRGSMPFALLHGESLVAIAAWSLGESGAELLDFNASWADVIARELPLVVHDPLCPGTPVGFLSAALEHAVASGAVVVGARPVTDTVKRLEGDVVGDTVDRSTLAAVASPVVLPAAVVVAHDEWPNLDDLPSWVESLRSRFPVVFLEAPPNGRRVTDASDLTLLEASTPDR